MSKKIKNTTNPSKNVNNTINSENLNSHLYNNCNMVIDFSFEGAFVSCKQGDFSNYLFGNTEFTQKFRSIMNDVQKLSQKTPRELFNGGDYRHCHKTKNEKLAIEIIKNIFAKIGRTGENFEQELGGEQILQVGLQSEVRLFGTVSGNKFRVYFIDYFHDFEYNQTKNERNKKSCKFCAITSNIE